MNRAMENAAKNKLGEINQLTLKRLVSLDRTNRKHYIAQK